MKMYMRNWERVFVSPYFAVQHFNSGCSSSTEWAHLLFQQHRNLHEHCSFVTTEWFARLPSCTLATPPVSVSAPLASSSLVVIVPNTCLSTIADRAFPVAASRLWNWNTDTSASPLTVVQETFEDPSLQSFLPKILWSWLLFRTLIDHFTYLRNQKPWSTGLLYRILLLNFLRSRTPECKRQVTFFREYFHDVSLHSMHFSVVSIAVAAGCERESCIMSLCWTFERLLKFCSIS